MGERREEAQSDVLPNSGWVKFNVDGETEGKSGPAGIGGVLRRYKRRSSLFLFGSSGYEGI